MPLIRQILKYWLFLIAACFGAYVLTYNQDRVYVVLPGIAEFTVVSAVAFLAAFLIGASTVTLHFIFDIVRKNLEIRKYAKRVRSLESELERLRAVSPTSNLDPSPDTLK